MKLLPVLCVISLVAIAPQADAYVVGGSNFELDEYPSPNCTKPTKPFDLSDQMEVDDYNADVETYIACVREYVENGNNDIKRIQEAQQDIIREANSL